MENLYWWEACYLEAVVETDRSLKLTGIDEALEAIKQRRLRPIRPGSAEDTRIRLAQEALEQLKAETCPKVETGPFQWLALIFVAWALIEAIRLVWIHAA